jgi:Fe-S-cluster containining protein
VEFERGYVYRTKNLRRLRTPRNAPCRFLAPCGCAVYAARPTQCRTFPFWPEILEDKKEVTAAAKYCPGIGQGELIQIEVAREQAAEMRAAHPHFY